MTHFSLRGFLLCLIFLSLAAGPSNLAPFTDEADVGKVRHPGSAESNAARHEFRVTGNGANIWGAEDAFHFVYRKASGDLSLSADISFPSPGKNAHRKACLMVRQSLEADAAYADVAVHGDGLISLQYRSQSGGATREIQSPVKAPAAVRLERKGNAFTLLVIKDGQAQKPLGPITVDLKDTSLVGLAVSSHDADVSETALFSNVILTTRP